MSGLAGGAIIAGGIMAVGALVKGIFGASRAKRKQRRAAAEKRRLTGELKSLEKSRQKVINPYDNVKNLSSLAKDLTGNLSNPYSNMGVATAAAEIQIEEADLALANTLDSLMASGASAGGATALAQAALQSKKGVSASIERQETANEKLKAQGQQTLERLQNQEQQRIQGIEIGEGRRVQTAEATGRTFKYKAQERREVSKINYTRRQITGEKARENEAYNQRTAAIGNAIGGVTSGLSSMAGAGAFGGGAGAASSAGGGFSSGSIDFVGGGRAALDQGASNLIRQGIGSDRKLKENIKLIGKSPSGLKIYAFEYIDKIFGKGIYQGVMSDEIPSHAIIKNNKDYDMVDYSKIDVDFKQI